MVRFGKNGSDATSGAVRVARAYTGRERIAACGYHGWQDWYIGIMPSRALGVPDAYKALIHPVPYNDLAAMEAAIAEFPTAAVIMEPMTTEWPEPGYLEGVRALTLKHGVILVFDEMVTGFRFANGGAQEYFGVTPDLASFGKGMANGFPLSAVAGREDLMRVLEDAFISGTFGGELLSLTAANVVLDRIATTDVVERIAATGAALRSRLEPIVTEAGLDGKLWFSGHPAWTFVMWDTALPQLAELKMLFMQEMARNGVLMIATHNVSAAHDADALDTVEAAYRATLPVIAAAIADGDAVSRLDAEVASLGPAVR
jgi:glutamate-1-semialdehyde 2,1-aminomutase